MPSPLLLDLSHTCHTRARTGIQRVTRSLYTALGRQAIAVTYDPHQAAWRELEQWERENLMASSPAAKRGAQWPATAKLRSKARRLVRGSQTALPPNGGLIVPEVFSSTVAGALPSIFNATSGPRVALFHDAIALKYPELTPANTVARFPAYLVELLRFDGVAAVSEDSRASLIDYWRWLGVHEPPPVKAISLGIEPHRFTPTGENSPAQDAPVVLSVGSLEGRKNHMALLEACERLWCRGEKFSLHLIGLAHAQTGAAALKRIQTLQAAGRQLRYDGAVSDAAVDAAYGQCAFTVYPSLMEGFGLPVIESLSHGRPCICSARGALGESARGGGCVLLDSVDAGALAGAIHGLLSAPQKLSTLATEARTRRFKSTVDYARELAEWICELSER